MNVTLLLDWSALAVVVALLLAGVFAVVRSTRRREGRWGINAVPLVCPKCGSPAPPARMPTSARQAMWGGWTCSGCGCEMDKWGKAIL